VAETVHPELLRYVAELADQSAASRPSLFWERQLAAGEATAAVPVAEISPAEAEQVLRASAYGFEALDPGVDVADAPSFLEAFERIGDARKLAKRVAPGKVDLDKDQWEHLRALDFLQRKDWIDAYLESSARLACTPRCPPRATGGTPARSSSWPAPRRGRGRWT
jgi:hypothetical protein